MGLTVRQSRSLVCGIVVLAGALLQAIAAGRAQSAPDAPRRPLRPGEAHSSLLSAAVPEAIYQVTVPAGSFVSLAVVRHRSEIQISVKRGEGAGPDVDTRGRRLGTLRILAVSDREETVTVRLSASCPVAACGFDIRVERIAPAGGAELAAIEAFGLYQDAGRLHAEGTADARRRALGRLRNALGIWEAIGDERGAADTLFRLGLVHSAVGDMKASLAAHDRARELFVRLGDAYAEADAAGAAGVAHRTLGNHEAARAMQARALEVARASGDRVAESYALHNLGAIAFADDEHRQAIAYYEQSLALKRAEGDLAGLRPTLTNLGSVRLRLGEPYEALDMLREAVEISRGLSDARSEAYARLTYGTAHLDIGDWQRAIEELTAALDLFRRSGDSAGEGQALHNLGAVYFASGALDRSLDYYMQALPLRRASGNPATIATTLQNIGSIHLEQKQPAEARPWLEEALELKRRAGDRYGESYSLAHLARLHRQEARPAEALAALAEARELSRRVKDRGGEAAALYQLAALHAERGELDSAAEQYQEALRLQLSIRHRRAEARTRYGLARVERARGRFEEARRHLEGSLDTIEAIRSGLASPDLRGAVLADTQDVYGLYIAVLMELHRRTPSAGYERAALQVSERARARRLVEARVESGANLRSDVDPALLARERRVHAQLDAKEESRTRALAQNSAADVGGFDEDIRRLLVELDEVRARIRASNPRYAGLVYPTPAGVSEIQTQVLDRETVLLEYALGEERSYLWVVTGARVAAFELPPRVVIDTAVRRFYEALSARQAATTGGVPAGERARIAAADREAERLGLELSRMLLAPAAGLLEDRRLAIVADGSLQYLPFGALPAPRASAPETATEPLIARHETVYLPSATLLMTLRATRSAAPPAPVAIIGDPVFSPDDPRVSKVARQPRASGPLGSTPSALDSTRSVRPGADSGSGTAGAAGFRRLPFSRREAESIASLFAPDARLLALDFEASRQRVIGTDLGRYGTIHFATHAVLDPEFPELSGVVLSLVDPSGRTQDGFLRLHEIYALQLNAGLVVLSACQTALGRELRGEGLQGLARGFMHAGASRVAGTLWQVDDRATARLMKRFYELHVRDGRPPSAALHQAAREMSREARWRAPYYWAGFILQGEWQ